MTVGVVLICVVDACFFSQWIFFVGVFVLSEIDLELRYMIWQCKGSMLLLRKLCYIDLYLKKTLRVLPAVTRLTVYRRLYMFQASTNLRKLTILTNITTHDRPWSQNFWCQTNFPRHRAPTKMLSK